MQDFLELLYNENTKQLPPPHPLMAHRHLDHAPVIRSLIERMHFNSNVPHLRPSQLRNPKIKTMKELQFKITVVDEDLHKLSAWLTPDQFERNRIHIRIYVMSKGETRTELVAAWLKLFDIEPLRIELL